MTAPVTVDLSAIDDAASALPYALGGPLGTGQLRVEPEDFQVQEIGICEPDGSGEHVWLWVRKRNANTEWVARQLARFAGVSPREVSYAGLKDRHAVTEQWFSIQLPGKADPDWQTTLIEGVEILRAQRHSRKLKRGALRGNRFRLRARAFNGNPETLTARVAVIVQRGVPNYFGVQRFGRGGQNLAAAAVMLRGEGPRIDRHVRGLYLSAVRSYLFNQVLAARVLAASWDRELAGDAIQLAGSRAWFIADGSDPTLEQRLADLDVHPTGPLWGRGPLATQAAAHELETSILSAYNDWCKGLERAGLEQDRRALRIAVPDLEIAWLDDTDVVVQFSLPSGCYATTVLRELIATQTDVNEEEATG